MNLRYFFLLFLSFQGPLYANPNPKNQRWDFNHMLGWVTESQDNNPLPQVSTERGRIKIWTRAQSKDRKKIHTASKIYTTGRYRWRTFIPEFGKGDQTSVGSWLYCDDKHELDFEVGYGKEKERKKYLAKDHEVLAYMTSQAGPYSSTAVPIEANRWHQFEIDISLKDEKYFVEWFINGKSVHRLQTTFGLPIAFYIYCSVENLSFIGDAPASKDCTGLFDYVEYRYHP